MSNQPNDDSMPDEIDFTNAVRSLHHIPPGSKVFLPASIERSVWQYFSAKAQEMHVPMSDLLTEILRREMENDKNLR
jgi:hypothetical protein